MLSFTRRRLIVLFLFVAIVVFVGFKFGPGSRAQKSDNPVMLGGPAITATMTAAPTTDVGTNGAFVNPGDTLEYTVTLNNTGSPASDVVFTDNLTDANLTLVPGSIKASPIATNDTYPVTGNVRISTANGAANLLANDIRPTTGNNTGLTITTLAGDNTAAFAGTSAQGGQVTAATGDGSFAYNPAPGFEGADSFTYTVTDPDGLTATGTVNITVTGMIWFVQAGAPAGGDGRLSAPFNCLVGAGCFDPVAADGVGDNIFLYSGAYTGGLTLLGTQKVIGQGATTTLAGIAGITLATGSDALPALGGARPTVTTTLAGTNAINLGLGNTLRGFDIGNTTAADISGVSFGTLTASEIDLNGTGRTLNLSTGTLAATFGTLISTSSTGGPGINLSGIGGTLTVTGSTSITGASTRGISVSGSSLNADFGTSTSVATSGSDGIFVGTSTGNIGFGNTTITGGGDGVSLQGNTAGTRTFGTLTISGGTGIAFNCSTGGNLTVTGAASLASVGEAIFVSGNTGTLNFQGATTATNTSGAFGVVWQGTSGSMTFSSLSIQTNQPNATALFAQGGGTINVTNGTGTINNTTVAAPAIVADGVALNVNFAAIKSSGSTNSVSLTNVTGSSNFGTGTLSGASGATFLISGGTCSTTYLGNITQANNAPLVSITGHSAGTVTFLNGPGTLSATNGTGLLFDNADGLYNFNGITTLNGGDAGIDIINGSAGSFTFNGSTSITNPSGIAYREDTSTPSVTFAGTITKNNNAASAVSINAKTGGTTNLNGAITATTTTANAINLTGNSGSTVAFGNTSGNSAITTTSGNGFNITGGGTVNITGNNYIVNSTGSGIAFNATAGTVTATGTGNTLTSTTGSALSVVNTTIGASNLTFKSITAGTAASGPANGIVLNTTGVSGGLKVTGTSTTDGSGGTIQSNSARGLSANSTSNLSLTNMAFTNANGNDGAGPCGAADNSGCNAAIYINTATNVILDNVDISGTTAEQGINLKEVNGFQLLNSSITNAGISSSGTDTEEAGLYGINVFGTSAITNTNITFSAERNAVIYNTNKTSTLTVTNSHFDDTQLKTLGADGFEFSSFGASNSTLDFVNCNFLRPKTNGLQVITEGTSHTSVDITGSTFDPGTGLAAAIDLDTNAGGDMDFNISNNPSISARGINVINIFAFADSTFEGRINNNTITNAGTHASGGAGAGVRVISQGNGNSRVEIKNNNVTAKDDDGIIAQALLGTGRLDATITGNTVSVLDTGAYAIDTVAGASSSTFTNKVCANVANNITTAPAGSLGNYRARAATASHEHLLQGSGATVAANWNANTNSPLSPTAFINQSGAGVFTFGATCLVPANPLPLPPPPARETAQVELSPANVEMASVGAEMSPANVETASADLEIRSAVVEWSPAGNVTASAEVEMASANIEWASANVEIEPTLAETAPTVDYNTPSTFGAIASLVDKMASQISPTVYSQGTEKETAPEAGTVTVNGGGSGFAIPTGKSTTITFRATIANPTAPVNTFSVSNQGTVTGTGFAPVSTDGDAGTAGAQPTTTVVVQPPTITKTFTPANILLDQQSTLTLTINNTNPAQAVTGITVTDTFPANVVVASPLTASTTCGAGTLQNDTGGVLTVGDPGIKLVGGTRNAAQSCTVTVKVRGTSGGTYVNTTGNVASFEGFVGTTASNTLNVSILTATELSISGRVLTSEGRGVRGARVVITGNSLAQPISVFTGVNGTYQVNGLAAGETYIVTVMSRRFAFENPSRVVTLIDNVTDADFIGSSGTGREQ